MRPYGIRFISGYVEYPFGVGVGCPRPLELGRRKKGYGGLAEGVYKPPYPFTLIDGQSYGNVYVPQSKVMCVRSRPVTLRYPYFPASV